MSQRTSIMFRSRNKDDSSLPRVSESEAAVLPQILTEIDSPPPTPQSDGTQYQLIDGSRVGSRTTLGSPSVVSSLFRFNNFNSYIINDLTNYTMNDQRWTLQRKKIGLKRKTVGATQKKTIDERSKDLTLKFVKTFKRKECINFVPHHGEENGTCFCGLQKHEHLHLPTPNLMAMARNQLARNEDILDQHVTTDNSVIDIEEQSSQDDMVQSFPEPIYEENEVEASVRPISEQELEEQRRLSLLTAEGIVVRRRNSRRTTMQSEKVDADDSNFGIPKALLNEMEGEVEDDVNSQWKMKESLVEYPTNAYGQICFVNETFGSSKPAKYVRMSNSTAMESVLSLLTDYWRLNEPTRPNLVLSVTGGAKNFKLDGNRKATFSSGLIKAVKSTNAWLVTGGVNVGVMRSVGEAVNEGQHILKIRRKNVFAEESVHLVRGIKCIGVAPWGYIKDFQDLINPNPSQFSRINYRVDDKIAKKRNISLNGDHTHFIFVDNGMRYSFTGADRFRTRLEEAIRKPEPTGLGIPLVLLLLEGGLSSIVKCSMALKSRIPVVVVAGTGRAADLISFGVSMTHEAPSGKLIMRKAHRKQLDLRVEATMGEYKKGRQKMCADMVVQCCQRADLITIYDINSGDAMDKYILYALLKGDGLNNESSRLEQLNLSLLWNRPDIAESHIFPALPFWPTGCLEDLTTVALLEEKVEFIRLFMLNGLVVTDYLTVANLRHLYNASMDPNLHLTRLLQCTTRSKYYHLSHVHKLLLGLIGQHNDDVYKRDTPNAVSENTAINYYTFEDPNLELFLWSILSGRNSLAYYLWERCNSPLSSAVVGSLLYRALFLSLGAKNTELRTRYSTNSTKFEKFAVQLLEECYAEDPVNAMGLVERRIAKWGNLDILDLALAGNELNFLASTCCQASIDLSWQRGMVRASTFPSIIAMFLPVLVWTRLFSFQKLGDTGGELTRFQKLLVFYKSPMTKFYGHSLAFISFLTLYAYVVLFDFRYQMTLSEKFLIFWMVTNIAEEISELYSQQSNSLMRKLSNWWESVWNRFDLLAFCFAVIAVALRSYRSTFGLGRIVFAFNTAVYFVRVFRLYHIHYSLGPKLVIFYRMVSEVAVFMALLIIFILGYGLASQSLLKPSPSRHFDIDSLYDTVKSVLLIPYWQMYGELLIDELKGPDTSVCHPTGTDEADVCENPSQYSWAVYVMLIFYLIIGNIMLLNLLIAIFTYVFDEVHEHSMEIWKFERFRLIREFDSKPGLVPPFVILEHAYRLAKLFWKSFIRKNKENLDDYMTETLLTLQIFEKEAVSSFLTKLHLQQDSTLEKKVSRIAEKIDIISKYVEQEQELRQFEEDMEWMAQETELDEDVVENHPSSGESSVPNSPKHAAENVQINRVPKGNKENADLNKGIKGLSDNDDDDDDDHDVNSKLPTWKPLMEKTPFAKQKVMQSRISKMRPQKYSKLPQRYSEMMNQFQSKSSKFKMQILPTPMNSDISYGDQEQTVEVRNVSEDEDNIKKRIRKDMLGSGWDGELHYPSRPSSSRASRSATRSAHQAVRAVAALHHRIDHLSETMAQSQRALQEMLSSLLDKKENLQNKDPS